MAKNIIFHAIKGGRPLALMPVPDEKAFLFEDFLDIKRLLFLLRFYTGQDSLFGEAYKRLDIGIGFSLIRHIKNL